VLPITLSLTAPNPTLATAIVRLLIVCATGVVIFFSFFNVIFWLPIAIPLIIIYVASAFNFVAEFVMRKLAEYPKERSILAALVALLKAVG
jgi:ABC-type bacteriocin/lantibiotic exporter with double-glycine peptidase domain